MGVNQLMTSVNPSELGGTLPSPRQFRDEPASWADLPASKPHGSGKAEQSKMLQANVNLSHSQVGGVNMLSPCHGETLRG